MRSTFYNSISIGLLLIFLSSFNHSKGQVLNLEWDRNLGGPTQFDDPRDVAHDPSGNVYTAGDFWNTSDFDPGPGVYNLTSDLGPGAFIQKMDGNGNLLWAHALNGPNSQSYVHSVKVNDLGDVFLMGGFTDSADFDPGPGVDFHTSQGTGDIFIWKFNSQGDYQWVKFFENNGRHNNQRGQIAFDADYNIHLTGTFRGTVDFDPGPAQSLHSTSGGSATDMFVVKLDSSGNLIWAQDYGAQTTGSIWGRDIAVNSSGSILITGFLVNATVDMDLGPGTSLINTVGASDIFVLKLDANGQYQWAHSIGGTGAFQEEGRGILPTADGGAYVVGEFSGTVDFDPGPGVFNLTADYYDVFVLKLNNNGEFVWAGALVGADTDDVYGFDIDSQENLYLSGRYDTDIDLDPGPGVNQVFTNGGGASDVFICKLDSSGDMVWGYSLGGPFSDGFCFLSLTDNHEIYLAGRFHTLFDSDPGPGNSNLASNGSLDIFVAKISEQVILSFDPNVPLGIREESGTLIATGAIGAYRWLDCNKGLAPIRGTSHGEFNPVVAGDYAVERTLNGQIDTSMCMQVRNIDVIENLLFSEVVLYPNPTHGEINLYLGTLQDVDLRVFDLQGRLIWQETNLMNSHHILDLDIESGIYIVELQAHGKRKRYKMVVD